MTELTVEQIEALEVEVERELNRPAWLSERVQSLDELNNEDIPELEWIVPDLLTEGITVLAGMLKSGKSMLIVNVGLAIAEGLPVLGHKEAKQGRVLYITPDDKQKTRIRARIQAMRGDRTDPIPFDVARDWTPLADGGTDEIDEYLEYFPDTRLVIIDVLMNVLPDIRESADAYSEIYQKLEPLKAVSQKRHVAIVLVMHMNKGGNGNSNPRSRIYGSMAYGAIADNILLLDEDYNTHQRYLITAGKDLEQGKFAMAYEPSTGRYAYGEKRIEELNEKSASQNIGDMVRARPGLTRKAIKDRLIRLGIGEEAAEKRVTRAVKSGEIHSIPGLTGFYHRDYSPPTPHDYDDDYDPDEMD